MSSNHDSHFSQLLKAAADDTKVFQDFVGYSDHYLRKPYYEGEPIEASVTCPNCGAYLFYKLVDDVFVLKKDTPCFTDTTIKLTLKAPSGILLCADWQQHANEVYAIAEKDLDGCNVNSRKGIAQTVNRYAQDGIAHFLVGNSSPEILQTGDKYIVGRYYEDDYDEDIPDDQIPPPPYDKNHGYVCTDLWWVSIVDYEVYRNLAVERHGEERGTQIANEAMEAADVVLKVEPGDYELIYDMEARDQQPMINATFVRIPNQ